MLQNVDKYRLLPPDKQYLVKRLMLRNRLWKGTDYHPHAKQKEVHLAIARGAKRVIMNWGRRTGKTICGASEILVDMGFPPDGKLPTRGMEITAPKSGITERVFGYLWDWIVDKRVFGCEPLYKATRERYIEMPWRARIEGKTTDDTDNLRGEGLVGRVADEHASDAEDILRQYLLPPLFDTAGWCMLISTPKGRNNHFCNTYTDWHAKMTEGNPLYFASHATSYDNPFINLAELEEYKAACMATGMMDLFDQEIMAMFTSLTGAIYPNFQPIKEGSPWHVQAFDPFPNVPFILGIDWGFSDPFVCLLAQRIGEVIFVLDEITVKNVVPDDQAAMIWERVKKYLPWCFKVVKYNHCAECGFRESQDDTEYEHGFLKYIQCPVCGNRVMLEIVEQVPYLGMAYCDPESPSNKAVFLNNNIPIYVPDTSDEININDVVEGINWVRAFFGRAHEPAIVIHPRCTNLIRYIAAYVRKRDGSEKPLEKDDHFPDALRYLVVGSMGCRKYEPFRFAA